MKLEEHTTEYPTHTILFEEKGWNTWGVKVMGKDVHFTSQVDFYPDDAGERMFCETCGIDLTNWEIA